MNLAQGGDSTQVQGFFNSLLPKSTASNSSTNKAERNIVGMPSTPMDLTGLNFIKK